MTSKTDNPNPKSPTPNDRPSEPDLPTEFSGRYLRPLIMLSLAALLLVYVSGRGMWQPPWITSHVIKPTIPYLVAAGKTIGDSISRFQGDPLEVGWDAWHSSMLAGLLVAFVLGPTLFFFALRKINTSGGESRPTWLTKFGYVVGGALMLVIPLVGFEGLYSQYALTERMKHDTIVSENRDQTTRELSRLAFRARELWILPHRHSGFEQRWKNRGEGAEEARPVEISDLAAGERFQRGEFFVADVTSDTSLVLIGVGVEQGNAQDFVNWNGEAGRVQVRAEVTPLEIQIQVEN